MAELPRQIEAREIMHENAEVKVKFYPAHINVYEALKEAYKLSNLGKDIVKQSEEQGSFGEIEVTTTIGEFSDFYSRLNTKSQYPIGVDPTIKVGRNETELGLPSFVDISRDYAILTPPNTVGEVITSIGHSRNVERFRAASEEWIREYIKQVNLAIHARLMKRNAEAVAETSNNVKAMSDEIFEQEEQIA